MCLPEHDQELMLLLSKYEVPSTGPSYTHTHTHTPARKYTYIRMYVCEYTHTHIHTRTHTHTQVRTHHSPINPGDRQQHQRQHQYHLSERPPRSTQHPTALVCIFYSFFFCAISTPRVGLCTNSQKYSVYLLLLNFFCWLVSIQIFKSTLYIDFYLVNILGH